MGPGNVEMMLEGRVLSPAEAGEIGLVHRVVAPDRLLAEATATAERLARRAPGSVAALKRAVYEGGSKELEQGLALERDSGLRRGVGAARRAAPARPEARAACQEGTAGDMTTDSS